MKVDWFIFSNNRVSGPFSTETVRDQLMGGLLSAGTHIWRKGQREWLSIDQWETAVAEFASANKIAETQHIWYVDLENQSKGPLTHNELIQLLKPIQNLGKVRLWSSGMKQWAALFDCPDIVESLGLSRRENLRAPLMGQAVVSRSNDDPRAFMLKTGSVSTAGISLSGHHDLRLGDSVSIAIKSPQFSATVYLRGKVSYVTRAGFAGVIFDAMNGETEMMLTEHVKLFSPRPAALKSA